MTKKAHHTLCACWAALLTVATVSCCVQSKGEAEPALLAAVPVRIVSPFAAESATETETETLIAPETERVAPESETQTEAEYISLGEYKLTAYCACEKCCGAWARIRPIDKDGKPIVYTASMAEAKQGVTIAADTNVHPFGTVLVIDGKEYTVQDRGGAVKGKHVDIYFESHEEAKQFGVQYKDVFIKECA